jgi:hypothetical protein
VKDAARDAADALKKGKSKLAAISAAIRFHALAVVFRPKAVF